MSKSQGIRTRHSQETKDKILEMKVAGVPAKEIAVALNVKLGALLKIIKNSGIKSTKEQHDANRKLARQKNTKVYPPDTTDRIVELYLQLNTREEISKALDVDINRVISDIQRLAPRRLTEEERNSLRFRKYTNEQYDRAATLRKDGKLLDEIVEVTGVKAGSLMAHFHKCGIKLDPKIRSSGFKVTDQFMDDRIIDLRKSGMSKSGIAIETGVNLSKIKRVLSDSNVVIDKTVVIENAQKAKYNKFLIRYDIAAKGERYQQFAQAKGGQYLDDYDKEVRDRALWMCAEGHVWESLIYSVLADSWCVKCNPHGTSEAQVEIEDYIKSLGFTIRSNDNTIIKPKHVDIYVVETGLTIEFNGIYYHSSAMERYGRKPYDKYAAMRKCLDCHTLGHSHFMIFEDEWLNNKELVKAMIKWRLGRSTGLKLNARDLEIRRLSKNRQFRDFFNRNHLEGNVNAKFGYGLFCGDKLVQAVSVKSVKKDDVFEIKRLASDYDYIIRGGAQRLVAAVIKEIGDKALISYSNNRLSSGDVYMKMGAKEITTSKTPNYYYVDLSKRKRISRQSCMKLKADLFPEILEYPEIPHTEKDQCESGLMSYVRFGIWRPLYRIDDCGHKKWLLNAGSNVTVR